MSVPICGPDAKCVRSVGISHFGCSRLEQQDYYTEWMHSMIKFDQESAPAYMPLISFPNELQHVDQWHSSIRLNFPLVLVKTFAPQSLRALCELAHSLWSSFFEHGLWFIDVVRSVQTGITVLNETLLIQSGHTLCGESAEEFNQIVSLILFGVKEKWANCEGHNDQDDERKIGGDSGQEKFEKRESC